MSVLLMYCHICHIVCILRANKMMMMMMKFDVDSSSHFPFRVRTQTETHKVTDANDHSIPCISYCLPRIITTNNTHCRGETQIFDKYVPIVEWFLSTLAWLECIKELIKHCIPTLRVGRWVTTMLPGRSPIYVHFPRGSRHTAATSE